MHGLFFGGGCPKIFLWVQFFEGGRKFFSIIEKNFVPSSKNRTTNVGKATIGQTIRQSHQMWDNFLKIFIKINRNLKIY